MDFPANQLSSRRLAAPAGILIVAPCRSVFEAARGTVPKRPDHGRTSWDVCDDDAHGECFETRTWVPYNPGGLRDLKAGRLPSAQRWALITSIPVSFEAILPPNCLLPFSSIHHNVSSNS